MSERGRSQAQATARFLSVRHLSAVYTSPLLRARQTAEILAHQHPHLRPHLSRALLEVRTAYQGSSNSILKPGFSFYEPLKEPSDETMRDVFDRMVALLRLVTRRHVGQSVALVSHADPIAITRVGLEGKPLTAANLHSTVYPERSSITQIVLAPAGAPRLAYFDLSQQSRSA